MLTNIIVSLAFLLGNAFFVGAEFAVLAARRSQIEPRAEAGSKAAAITLQAMERVSLMLAMAQLGITLCSLGLGAVAEASLAHLLEPIFEAIGVPHDLVHPIAFVIALGIVVYLHVVVGEMIPKNLSIAQPERAALVLAPALMAFAVVFKPVIVVLNWMANLFLRMGGIEPKDEVTSAYTVEQVESIVNESTREGLLTEESSLLAGALRFSGQTAGECMVRTAELVAVDGDATPAEIEERVAQTGYSRFPVFNENADLVGYLHVKDVLYASAEERGEPVPTKRLRTFVSVRDTDEIEDALAQMQSRGAHLARVLDATGEDVGVLFLEDILEELVGVIRDVEGHTSA